MNGPRRRSREVALQVLHVLDVSPELGAAGALSRTFGHLVSERGQVEDVEDDGGSAPSAQPDRALVEEIVRGVAARQAELDEALTKLSRNWRLERMAVVERNIIRLSLWELLYAPSVPVPVVINEAVELAKRFGTGEGASFVNGLLDRAVTELEIRRDR
jgi:N utilization substance protein B